MDVGIISISIANLQGKIVCLIKCHEDVRRNGVRVPCIVKDRMEVKCQLHTPAALCLVRETVVQIGWESRWVPVSARYGQQTVSGSYREPNPNPRSFGLS